MGYFSNQDAINKEERYDRQLTDGDYDRELDGYDKKNLKTTKQWLKEYKEYSKRYGKKERRNYEPDHDEDYEEENGFGRK